MVNLFSDTYDKLHTRNIIRRFIVLVSFELAFIVARIVTYLQRIGALPDQPGPNHIHHLVPGIILVLIGGYLGIAFWNFKKLSYFAAAIFGIGAALTLDEFALWLNLKDVYWEEAGRRSIDVVILASVALALVFAISEAHDHRWWPFKSKA